MRLLLRRVTVVRDQHLSLGQGCSKKLRKYRISPSKFRQRHRSQRCSRGGLFRLRRKAGKTPEMAKASVSIFDNAAHSFAREYNVKLDA